MAVRIGDQIKQVNDSIEYPVTQAPEVQVLDTAGNFSPPSIRDYKDLESVLAELATSISTAGQSFIANFSDSSLDVGQPVAVSANDTVVPTDATDINFPVVGFCAVKNSPSPGQCVIQTGGPLSGFVGLTAGKQYLLSKNTGEILATDDDSNINYPNSNNDFFQILGTAINSTTLVINIRNTILVLE